MEYGQQGQHGTTGRVDQYGNPVGTGTGGGMGQLGEHGGAGMGGGQFQPVREEHKTGGGVLHRSGSSSSSSSSEDDGMGGRRKKGLKEKMPGGHKAEDQQHATGTTEGTAGEKKGIMDKIKEKLPGQH
ncbi:hypothetical protein BS78_07G228100 [Paspalum vaginatum]|nr:hypothetical protein BS78_07G228100 [Paspalum vaginatum]